MSALRQSRFIRIGAALSVIAVLILAVNVASAATNWNQGFEVNTSGWIDDTNDPGYGHLVRVAGGTNGIAASAGANYAQATGIIAESGPFTRFDGYRSAWPGDWTAEIDVYLDPAWPAGAGFDYSVAATGTDGKHRRDFIFHIAKDTSTGKLLVAGSNNSGFQTREDLEGETPHAEVTTAGWYTLKHVFRNNAGVLAVDLKLINAGGTVLLTKTLSDPSDTIPALVGGNRYGWFTFISNGLTLPVDEHQMCLGVDPCQLPATTLVVAPTDTTLPVFTNVCPGGVLKVWTRGWTTCDENSTAGTGYVELITGPATPPAGIGSANFVTAGPANGPAIFNNFEPGLPLNNLFQVNYSTYAVGSDRPYFFINVDYDLADASYGWQGRLTWIASLPGCAALADNVWQTLAPLGSPDAACWYQSGTPVVGGVASPPLFPLSGSAGSWNQILAAYPRAGIHASLGSIGFKVGSGSQALSAGLDKLTVGFNNGSAQYVTWDFEPGAKLTTTATPATVCAANQVKIDLADVPAAYGYEFIVDYDPTLVTPTAAFATSLFNPALGTIPGGWNAQCASGQCKFALTLKNPAPAVSGSGTVATIDLVAKKAGTFNLLVHDLQLSDEDGTAMSVKMPATPLSVSVCGTATISGRVSLQGRLTPMDTGTVTLTPKAGGAPVSGTFNAADGSYSLTVLYPPGGAAFVLQASHQLYLSNSKDLNVSAVSITGQNTRLLGGDALNNGNVDIGDLGCITGAFGLTTTSAPPMGNCGGAGSPDINLDLKVNIQDLSLAGGNYDKSAPQGW